MRKAVGRSLQDLVALLQDLEAKRVDLYLDREAVDTSTPMGRAMFQIAGVFAQLERSIIQERVKAGLARARAQGKRLGRPPTDPQVEDRIRELRKQGRGMLAIGRELNIGTSVVQRVLAT